jgi:hypothetical protein
MELVGLKPVSRFRNKVRFCFLLYMDEGYYQQLIQLPIKTQLTKLTVATNYGATTLGIIAPSLITKLCHQA